MGASELLRYMVEVGASDLHLRSGSCPFVRVDGQLEPAQEARGREDPPGAAIRHGRRLIQIVSGV